MVDPINTTSIPADVRAAGPDAVKLYGAALQFEGLLVQQITEQMFQSTQDDSSSEDDSTTGGDAGGIGAGPYQSMLPSTLADSITQGGGLGLAGELYRSMALRAGIGTPAAPDSGSGEDA
jgi:Rod binding domain-containing protein